MLVAHMARRIAPQGGGNLFGLAAIGLVDRDHRVDARLDWLSKYAGNARHAGRIQCIPRRGRALDRAHDRVFAVGPGDRAFDRAPHDRAVSMGDAGDFGDMLAGTVRRVIAGEFGIGAFFAEGRGIG